jgi:4-hydroxythreonine-4-phosphate dehydrogenase
LLVTSGEPAGIGPDLCIAIALGQWPCELVIAGDRAVLLERAHALGVSIQIHEYTAAPLPHQPGIVRLAHFACASPVTPGVLNVSNSRYVLDMLDFAAAGCLRGEFDAIVTAPVQKSVINDAGVHFSGHTEYLAEKTNADPVMMLVAESLRVALVTTHLPLSKVSEAITAAAVERTLAILHHDLKTRFGIARPRILVCGLNPHAGEGGYLGREDADVIAPALERLRASGMQLTGPAPADTAFTPRMLAGADAVLTMYHDQGLPVLKFAGFGNAVNVTLGLPIIRTSVDHGTALDLAGSGRADAGSLIAALRLAIELAKHNRTKN